MLVTLAILMRGRFQRQNNKNRLTIVIFIGDKNIGKFY